MTTIYSNFGNMDDKYKRVDCNFYDHLEIHATYKERLEIIYEKENGGNETIIVKIKTLETKDKAEFLITDEGQQIRLDKIISLRKL